MGTEEFVAAVVPLPGTSPPVVLWGCRTGEPIADVTRLMNFHTNQMRLFSVRNFTSKRILWKFQCTGEKIERELKNH
jgi:hypothetical protein